jgi:hypothetical protein
MSRTRSNPWASRIEYLEKENLRLKEENKCIQPLQEEIQRLRIGIRDCMRRIFGTSYNGTATDAKTIGIFTRLSPRATHFNINAIGQWTNNIPEMLWQQKILEPYLSLKELAIVRPTNSNFDRCWQHVLSRGVIRVPQGCPTVQKAMDLAVIFSERTDCGSPLRIVLERGVHEIVGFDYGIMNVTCSHITFVGKGKDQTTIRGGFKVENQQNVKFEELTIKNPANNLANNVGLWLTGSETNVGVLKCIFKECGAGMQLYDGATVTATQCEFMENGAYGVFCGDANTKARLNDCTMHHNAGGAGLCAYGDAVVDLRGTKTDIHSSKDCGICAYVRGKVNIHLPSQHNTSHDNVGEDRHQDEGGSIANINADGTFTHVVAEEEDE